MPIPEPELRRIVALAIIGLKSFPTASLTRFTGENRGKLLLEVA